jgi:hypothetical protein
MKFIHHTAVRRATIGVVLVQDVSADSNGCMVGLPEI